MLTDADLELDLDSLPEDETEYASADHWPAWTDGVAFGLPETDPAVLPCRWCGAPAVVHPTGLCLDCQHTLPTTTDLVRVRRGDRVRGRAI